MEKCHKLKKAVVYNPQYNIRLPFQRLFHRFDRCKYRRAYELLRKNFGQSLDQYTVIPEKEVQPCDILAAHDQDYIASLRDPRVVAKIAESPLLKLFSAPAIDKKLLSPMRYAAEGTLLAIEMVLSGNYDLVSNLGGGFHHGFRNHGEGFCVYNDLAIGLEKNVKTGALKKTDVVAVVDLDAHRGNGNMDYYKGSGFVEFFDIFNLFAYAGGIKHVEAGNDWIIPMHPKTDGAPYLHDLREHLPSFFEKTKPRFVYYVAGTDVVEGDPLGKLKLTPDDVHERDLFVMAETVRRGIPMVMVTGGGYTSASHKLVARTVESMLRI